MPYQCTAPSVAPSTRRIPPVRSHTFIGGVMKRWPLVVPAVLFFGLGSTVAFAGVEDDSRRGFVFGLGGGLAARASVKADAGDPSWGSPVDESSTGFAYQMVVGYGFND